MSSPFDFKGFYSSGIFIPDHSTVSALSLMFNKVYLPNNVGIIKAFSSKFKITAGYQMPRGIRVTEPSIIEDDEELFAGLNETQKLTASVYIFNGIRFFQMYKPLMGEVFESQLYEGELKTEDVILVKKGQPGEKNTYSVKMSATIQLSDEDQDTIPILKEKGYVPIVGKYHPYHLQVGKLDEFSSKQMAALLAMQSVQMVFPQTKAVHPDVILEARGRLSDQLPPFWSAMLKISVELKKRLQTKTKLKEVFLESQELVDTTVLPALIDLKYKMEKDKKDWFYKILSPVQKGLRLLVGNPPLTHQQLVANALILGSDVMMTAAENIRTIEALKGETGLTFLIEADQILNKT